ncbi:MAG: anti-sigma factor antagonist [Candidatus Omnitrophica bacterium]|nr:anti-sigma factor antagonist [Candidatus Omnitrophota bacterium]
MKIKVRYIEDVAIVEVEGKININSSKLIEVVGSILDSGYRKLIVDMKMVDFVDYNGLSVLAITYKNTLNNKGVMKLCNVSLHVQELLRVVRLDEVFDIYNDAEEAMEKLSKKPKKKSKKEDASDQQLRRRFQRLDIEMPISFKLSGKSRYKGDSRLQSGRVANISGAGIFIRTINIFPPGTKVDLEVMLKGSKELTYFEGVVMWLADKGLQADMYPGMGVAFTGIFKHAQEELIEFIEKHAVQRRDSID